MNRREVLRAGGVGLATLVTLSGCASGTDGNGERGTPTAGNGGGAAPTDRDGPDTATGTPAPTTPPPTAARTPTAGVDFVARFRAFLESQDIVVRELVEEGPIVTLRYATESTSYQAVSQDIGRVSGGFFRGVRDGWDVTRLEATVTDPAGTALARWYARVEWFREFQRGERSADELSLRVLRTVERTGASGTGTGTATTGTN